MPDFTAPLPVIFTAQSKLFFFCRDAICEYLFNQGGIPLNPFRMFGYFLDDRVARDLVRQGNTNLVRRADALWVFGQEIANGVLYEIRYAQSLGKPIRFFTVDSLTANIREIAVEELAFEAELCQDTGMTPAELHALLRTPLPLALS